MCFNITAHSFDEYTLVERTVLPVCSYKHLIQHHLHTVTACQVITLDRMLLVLISQNLTDFCTVKAF